MDFGHFLKKEFWCLLVDAPHLSAFKHPARVDTPGLEQKHGEKQSFEFLFFKSSFPSPGSFRLDALPEMKMPEDCFVGK